jgi:non-ribosomal peptide synthetase component F
VNGYRIELGEIETALQQHVGVREAIVTGAGNRLIAHVQGTADVLSLREHLAALLPGYMIPGEFRFIDIFPVTPNGKIDRLALQQSLDGDTTPVASGSSVESKVLALWSEILGRTVSDATANFFDLGGNSIHVAIVHVRLIEMTGRTFPITELFALPTARSIAEFLSPKPAVVAASSAQDRARHAQVGFSRFRPTSCR